MIPLPRFVTFHVTNRCNCRCRHCNIWQLPEPPAPETEQFCRAVDDLADWLGPTELVVAGGEPLLCRHTLPVLERAARRGLRASLATNGLLLDEAAVRRLAALGLEAVNISLDGFDHTHDRIRNQPGAFAQVLQAAEALHRAGIRVCAICVLMDDNLDQIAGLVDFLARGGLFDGIFFQAMALPFGTRAAVSGWWREHPRFPRDTARVRALLDEFLAMKRGGFFILNEDNQFPAMQAYFAAPDRFTLERCAVGEIGFTVNAGGDVMLCNYLEPIGNIARGSLREIYYSPAAERRRREMAACRDNCHLLINCCFDPSQLVLPPATAVATDGSHD